MSYEKSIQHERERDAQMRTSEIISERLEKIMLSGADAAARRWCWELLQNACDVTPPSREVVAEIELKRDKNSSELFFRHNGGAFTSKDLVRLTQQGSGKRRNQDERDPAEERPEAIGRFGTGFLTTHLLSRKVKVKGLLHEEGEEPRRLTIPLDRTGDTTEEIHEGVERTFAALDNIDQKPTAQYKKGALNTEFRYELDEAGVDVAEQGLEDLRRHLPYVLAFQDRIGCVKLVHRGLEFSVASRRSLGEHDETTFEYVSVQCASSDEATEHEFVIAHGPNTSLAVPIDTSDSNVDAVHGDSMLSAKADWTIQAPKEDIARLFCAFPLLGTSRLPVPVVINSTAFHPTEPRDGIHLTAKDHRKPNTNKELINEATQSLKSLISFTSQEQWHNLFHLARIGNAEGFSWLSTKWFQSNVVEPVRHTLLREPIVELASGARSAIIDSEGHEQVEFIVEDSEEARQRYWDLRVGWDAARLPKKGHVEAWNELKWGGRRNVAALTLSWLTSEYETLSALAESRDWSTEQAASYLEEVCQFLRDVDKEKYLNSFSFHGDEKEYPILPNQHGRFCFKSQMAFDDEIPGGLKDIASALGRDFRKELLHLEFAPDLRLGTVTPEDVADEIAGRVKDRFKETNRSSETRQVFHKLLQWFDTHPEVAQDLFEDLYDKKHRLRTDEEARRDRHRASKYKEQKEQLQAHGFSSLSEALDHIAQTKGNGSASSPDSSVEKTDVETETAQEVQELIAEWGIQSAEELEEVKASNPNIFDHVSEHSLEKLQTFLEMMGRVKSKVRSHLETNVDYDTSTWTDHGEYPTIVTIRKRGQDIHVVLRPADQNKVLFYAPIELDVLELPDAELWVQAGSQSPVKLTPGRILRNLGVEAQSGFDVDLA